jgi:hypothetical protein
MSTGGPSGFGQGGQPNFYPGRGYPAYGSDVFRDMPNDFVGGARGPAALPSRTTVPNGPAPATYPQIDGAAGTISMHRGAYVEDAGAPRLSFDFTFAHGTVPWSRPVYANRHGLDQYHDPTQQPSWTANGPADAGMARSPIPVQNKRIGNFTVRRPFGDNSSGTEFQTGSLAEWVATGQVGMDLQGRRWVNQSKTQNPLLMALAPYATAGSYGQTTSSLPTTPSNLPASNPYGAY